MKALNQIVEALVIGIGGIIVLSLFLILVIDINPKLAENNAVFDYLLFDGQNWLILPLIGLTVITGVIADLLASVIFRPWENYMRRNVFRPAEKGKEKSLKYYQNIRNFIFSNDQTLAIVESYQTNRVKIRICRSWVIYSIFIFAILAYYESQLTNFNPYVFPFMLLAGLIMIGALIGWHIATGIEHEWMEPFRE